MKKQQNLPIFGQLRDINGTEFVQEVEQVDHRIFVLVHLYESGISSCIRMHRILEELARQSNFQHVKFVRMACSNNGIEIDRIAFPMISLYRGGELVETISGLTKEFGEFFTTDDIQWLLEPKIT
jgi:thioredoxin-like negative regulator of GroEL